jgi:UDP-hydrolysing UDP-N-acetyl-D-glucosamine 2-epimerase
MKYKVNILSTSRSDYGILQSLIKKIQKNKNFYSKTIITGSHLCQNLGNTLEEIKKDKIKNIKILKNFKKKIFNDNLIFAKIFSEFSLFFKKEKPDTLIILGDRFEAMAVALAAKFNAIPIVHLHGGEKTIGSYDDTFRHCITKLANLHFVSKKDYKKRVVQLGENPENVFNFGSLSHERLFMTKLKNKNYLEKKLKIKFNKKNYLVTLHPETENIDLFFKKVDIFFDFLDRINNGNIFITAPSFDKGYQYIEKKIKQRVKKNNFFFVKSAGYVNYISLVKIVDCVIGNSSSGYYEVPALNNYTLDVGDRQNGRIIEKTIYKSTFNLKQLINNFKKINKLKKKSISKKKLQKKITSNLIIKKILFFLKNGHIKKTKKFFDLK